MTKFADGNFLVVARDRKDGSVLRTWGPYERSYAETVRADKSHEMANARLVVEETISDATIIDISP